MARRVHAWSDHCCNRLLCLFLPAAGCVGWWTEVVGPETVWHHFQKLWVSSSTVHSVSVFLHLSAFFGLGWGSVFMHITHVGTFSALRTKFVIILWCRVNEASSNKDVLILTSYLAPLWTKHILGRLVPFFFRTVLSLRWNSAWDEMIDIFLLCPLLFLGGFIFLS